MRHHWNNDQQNYFPETCKLLLTVMKITCNYIHKFIEQYPMDSDSSVGIFTTPSPGYLLPILDLTREMNGSIFKLENAKRLDALIVLSLGTSLNTFRAYPRHLN